MIAMPPNKRSLVAIMRTAETAAQVEQYCSTSTDIVADIRMTEAAVSEAPAIINGGADIVLVEAGHASQADLQALEQLCAYVTRGGSFIVIMEEPTADVVRRLFRAGVTDVLPTPVAPSELIAALNTARGAPAPAPVSVSTQKTGKILVVLKTAGGVGATTAAINLAGAFQAGKTGEIAVVDLDIQFGQAATALDVRPRMTILDAIRAGSRLDATLLASTAHRHSSGVSMLAAPNEVTPLEAVSEKFIDRLFAVLRPSFDLTIVEIPAAWSQWTGHVIDKADLTAPIVEASVRSATGAARISQSFVDFGLNRINLFLLANKFEKTLENSDRVRRIGEIFRVKPAGAIRYDAKTAADAADRGILFSAAAPKAPVVKDFETNAQKIAAALGLHFAVETQAPAAPLDRILGARLGLKGRQP